MPSQRNLVLISIDTCRADHLSVYNYHRPTTPVLEKLLPDAIVFDNAISAAPETAPSHMSLLTGLPPLRHGVPSFSEQSLFEKGRITLERRKNIRPLAEILKAHGYATAAFTGGGQVSSVLGFDQGFDLYLEGDESGVNGNRGVPFDPTRVLAWTATAKNKGNPFFLFVHTYIPHAPYLPPPPYEDMYDPSYAGGIVRLADVLRLSSGKRWSFREAFRLFWDSVDPKNPRDFERLVALYDGKLTYADNAVGQILAGFEGLGLFDDTMVIVTSDHGEQFLEHGEFMHPPELWDELLRVPLFIRLPETKGRGRRVKEVVSGLDLAPTVLDLLGLSPDPLMFGHSMLNLMGGRCSGWHGTALSEITVSSCVDDVGKKVLIKHRRSLRTSRYKFIQNFGVGAGGNALFDLENDPRETVNKIHAPQMTDLISHFSQISAEIDLRYGGPPSLLGDKVELPRSLIDELRGLGYLQ